MKVKLKDGRTGDLINQDGKVANIQMDATEKSPGGMIQVAVSEIDDGKKESKKGSQKKGK